jgi:hypothetical protein
MKVKTDFVTNSSSASFILTLRPHDGTMELSEFTNLFNKYLEDYKKNNPNSLRYWDATNIDEVQDDVGPNLFTINECVSMYNDADDVPAYIKELMINSYIRDRDWGFVVSSFKVDED